MQNEQKGERVLEADANPSKTREGKTQAKIHYQGEKLYPESPSQGWVKGKK